MAKALTGGVAVRGGHADGQPASEPKGQACKSRPTGRELAPKLIAVPEKK